MCVLSLVFFFKQKTAYEMRISDWSSDVCSSDLVRAGIVCEDRNRPHGLFDPFKPVANPLGFPYVEGYGHRGEALSAQTLRDLRQPLEIGRASCRERVCQYV